MPTPHESATPLRGFVSGGSVLDPSRDLIFQWRMAGLSTRQIAERLNVERQTVQTWLDRPENRRFIAEARREALDAALRAATTAAIPAIATLVTILQSDRAKDADRISAANSILRMLGMDRLASAMDSNTEAMMAGARSELLTKMSLMAERMEAIETTEGVA